MNSITQDSPTPLPTTPHIVLGTSNGKSFTALQMNRGEICTWEACCTGVIGAFEEIVRQHNIMLLHKASGQLQGVNPPSIKEQEDTTLLVAMTGPNEYRAWVQVHPHDIRVFRSETIDVLFEHVKKSLMHQAQLCVWNSFITHQVDNLYELMTQAVRGMHACLISLSSTEHTDSCLNDILESALKCAAESHEDEGESYDRLLSALRTGVSVFRYFPFVEAQRAREEAMRVIGILTAEKEVF